MRHGNWVVTVMIAALSFGLLEPARSEEPMVRIATALGNSMVAVDTTHARFSAANSLHYVDHVPYDGGRFHRMVTVDNQPDGAVKNAVIQTGIAGRLDERKMAQLRGLLTESYAELEASD